jgi:serine/threonine protein kinase
MPTVSTCPDAVRWGDLLDGRLPEAVARSLSSHLESCAGCQRTLERLTAGEPTWREAAGVLDERPRPELRRAMEQLKAEGEAALDTVGLSTVRTVPLPFLRPSANPEHLGLLGPYEVLGAIGRGGMGVVLQALDPALRRMVAIKVLAPEWAAHAHARERFDREARAAAQVRHDNVVAIHAVDEADGLPYLVMEYVPGVSLQQHLDRNWPLDIEEILQIGAQAAAGLAAAHAQGLVHRDVKPANILLDENDNVRLTDFGLARAVDDTSLTQTGVIAGTPQYMAPEQARGAPLDHRADLFSLGSVLYAMCTGRPPFRGPSTVAVLKRVCEEEARDVRDHNPEIPDWLAEIIDKLHAKKPRNRFRSADEVARLLNRYLRHLRAPDKFEKPAPLDQDQERETRSRWAYLLLIPAVPIPALLVWGAASLLDPKPDANPPGQGAPGPVVPNPAVPAPLPSAEGDVFFQKTLAELDEGNFFTRRAALERLATMRPNDQRARVAQKLIELTKKDGDQSMRSLAITALGTWGSADEVPALLAVLDNPGDLSDVWVRKAALKVIGRFRDARTLPAVIRCFRDDPHAHAEANQALREMGPMAEQDVLAIVNEPANNRIVFLKRAAIDVLADIGTEKSVPALRGVLASSDIHESVHLRESAQKALDAIDQRKKR